MHQFTIGCLGRARHGKGTIATLTKAWLESQGIAAQVIAFADPLKDFLTMLVGRSEPFRGNDQERNAPVPEILWIDLATHLQETAAKLGMNTGLTQYNPSGRQLMQLFGTEVIRERFCHNAWIRMANGRAKMFHGVTIIDDMRFTNEACPRRLGGICDVVAKTIRPDLPLIKHPSEDAVDEVPSDYIDTVFLNDKDISVLAGKVDTFMKEVMCSRPAH